MNGNSIGPNGAESLAAGLKENKGLQSLRSQAHLAYLLTFCAKASAPTDSSVRLHSLNAYALDVKQLRGEDPVEAIDLSGKGLGIESAVIIASLISSNTATKNLK